MPGSGLELRQVLLLRTAVPRAEVRCLPAGRQWPVHPHWKRGMSFLHLGLGNLQMATADTTVRLMAWLLSRQSHV
jgi:hypothetical protein